jgi:hypothetical protein
VRLAERRGRDFLERMLAAKRGDGPPPEAPDSTIEIEPIGSGH